MVDPLTNRPLPAHEVILMLLEHLRPALTTNGDDQLVEGAVHHAFVHGNGATRQRAAYATTGDLGHVAIEAARLQPALVSTTADGVGRPAARPRP